MHPKDAERIANSVDPEICPVCLKSAEHYSPDLLFIVQTPYLRKPVKPNWRKFLRHSVYVDDCLCGQSLHIVNELNMF